MLHTELLGAAGQDRLAVMLGEMSGRVSECVVQRVERGCSAGFYDCLMRCAGRDHGRSEGKSVRVRHAHP